MNYSSLSTYDLLKHRSHHVDSLTRLRRAQPQWDEDAARRGNHDGRYQRPDPRDRLPPSSERLGVSRPRLLRRHRPDVHVRQRDDYYPG